MPETEQTPQHGASKPSSDGSNPDRFGTIDETNRSPRARWSRIITISSICAIAAIIAVVVVTSEQDGPGSTQLRSDIALATIEPTTAASIASESTAAAGQLAPAAAPSTFASNTSNTTPMAPVVTAATTINIGASPVPAVVGNCSATETMPGGDNFYVPNAPSVENLGTGLVVMGTVREAETCEPVRNARIQIWLNTARGGEGEASNRGSVLTDENGQYRLETSPVVPQFGQPHVHIAYDDGSYSSLFLRAVMKNKDVPTFTVDFVLEPSDDG